MIVAAWEFLGILALVTAVLALFEPPAVEPPADRRARAAQRQAMLNRARDADYARNVKST